MRWWKRKPKTRDPRSKSKGKTKTGEKKRILTSSHVDRESSLVLLKVKDVVLMDGRWKSGFCGAFVDGFLLEGRKGSERERNQVKEGGTRFKYTGQ
jgi:hypothetical protein